MVAGASARLGMAKTAPKPPKAAAAADISTDDLQRSLRLDTYQILADSGAARGEIFTSISVGCATTNTPRRALIEGPLSA